MGKPPTGVNNTVSVANFLDWKQSQSSFAQLEAVRRGGSFNLTGADQPEKVTGALVTAGYFDLLGVKATLGRTFLSEEDKPSGAPVAVISHQLWRRRFGADPKLIGSEISVSGQKYAVVGVLPSDLMGKVMLLSESCPQASCCRQRRIWRQSTY